MTTLARGRAMDFVFHDGGDRRMRFVERRCHHHPFTGGQAIGLDHDRRAHFLDIIMRRVGIGKAFPVGGWECRPDRRSPW